ncbi:hypothetical protein HF086_017921 [Spodoptera exigua]|uniref:Ubiquitin-protein ligase E3B n=1 Tax=Spodoptera exigua TaxID=7107 RepID=A0A922MF63_SPOEX|nr:hypothetical protein HF086_017921 [Spodoptera exigua]
MYSKSYETTKDSFLEQAKAAREERAFEKKREQSATRIQAVVRGWLERKKFVIRILNDFDGLLPESTSHGSQEEPPQPVELIPALEVYRVTCRLFLVFKQQRDRKRFENLCKYIVQSLHSESVKLSYVGVFLNKEYSLRWIAHIKDLLYKCCQYLEELKPESPIDMQSILIHLHTLVAFTANNTWALTRLKNFEKLRGGMTQLCANVMGSLFHRGYYLTLKSLLLRGLCREKVYLKNISLTAIVTLSLRPLVSAQFSEKLLTMYIIQILSVPTLVYHMQLISPELVVTRFLDSCQQYVVCKKGNLSNWHPILGWFSQGLDNFLPPAMGNLRNQLSLLWGAPLLKKLLATPLKDMMDAGVTGEEGAGPSQPSTPIQSNNPAAIIRRAIEARTNRSNANKHYRKLGSPDCTKTALICSMYHTALQTMTQVKLDILTGLCNQDEILYSLWQFLCTLGPNCGLKSFLDLLAVNTKTSAPEILDDMEMYEQQNPFKLQDFINMSQFLNMFVYKSIMGQLFDLKTIQSNELFSSLHTLLLVLYRRDCRRAYTPANHWLVREIREGQFMADLEKGKKPQQVLVQKTPHMIAHGERVRLFRRAVADEKGIVVDVPFASFFLSQVLGQTQQALYSWIDELPSLDRDLYRSLTYIKHFQGDISSLELTFSVDEERLGEIVTHELVPGGKAVPVTNENKINYIHLMAHFRMHTQIKDQTNAFIKGFRTIINPEWLSLFSTPELQRLISGDNVPLDLRDLRRHTQYYGGFHDSHRVVCWLWDVLQRDFSEHERGMFLKFVTSCSKPPVLGFAHLKPPFSIRCVEVGDDEDTGDTIGSVIRGFFTIRKKDPLNRLPTSSTCFNLLKLPNYQKRSTLRDKLRYAVNSNTGFELS